MTSPVVVSRIQNRRGTQDQFDGLVYSPSGPNSVYPLDYTGVGGYYPGSPNADFTSVNYPNVLLPGELAFCTDSRKIFLGNLNGEFVELALATSNNVEEFLTPTMWELPPQAMFTPVEKVLPGPITVRFEYTAKPFFIALYDITDSAIADWNAVGDNFSKNGEFKITAINPLTVPAIPPVPPAPPFSPASLVDAGVAINATPQYDISFIAKYSMDNTKIELWYMHNFPGNLMLSSNTIAWLPI